MTAAPPPGPELAQARRRAFMGFFAVLAMLGGASVMRTHEVPLVHAVGHAMTTLDVSGGWDG